MPATSQILLPSTSHTSEPGIEPITGEKTKGAGYYGLGYGLHTVSFQVTQFSGDLKIQATLATDPAEIDWFDVDGASYSGNTSTEVNIQNFTGNFVWVRVVGTFTSGTVNRILLNY